MTWGWLPIAFLSTSLLLSAADSTPAPVTDPVRVAQHYHEVAARPEFQDLSSPLANTRFEDLLSQWFRSLGKKIGSYKYASQMPAVESLLMAVLVVLSISVLIYVMLRLTRRQGPTEPGVGDDSPAFKVPREPEVYDQEIADAVRDGNWHAAWLAGWRQFLSRLENRQLVDSDRTRTNREYLRQLAGRSLPSPALPLLAGMVDAYDLAIYGRSAIGESEWNRFHRQIEEACLLLHLNDRKPPGANSA